VEPDSVGGPETRFPIVGIGASAGGLAAFGAFFSAIPGEASTGMAFVLVQHLAPGHKSILSDLVKRYTRMKVYEVEDGIKVTPNCTYIIPRPTATWPSSTARCSCWNRPRRTASASPSIISSAPWPRTSASGPFASCSPARAATAH
jgi:chemotaxis response regulator CheB